MSKYRDVRFCSEHLMYDAATGSLYDPNTVGERWDQLSKLLNADQAFYQPTTREDRKPTGLGFSHWHLHRYVRYLEEVKSFEPRE